MKRIAPTVRWIGAAALLLLAGPEGLAGQRRFGRGMTFEPNLPYDGRFTFARIRYTVYGRSGWEFDYPTMERNLMTMMEVVTSLGPHVRGSNIFSFDDPELLKYPVAYLSEPGYWIPSEREAAGLRTYLAKGGFLIVDDFMQNEWYNFETQIRRALPGAQIRRLDLSHHHDEPLGGVVVLEDPEELRLQPLQARGGVGHLQRTDPEKRVEDRINYNNDIGDYMEWSGTAGWWPVNITNEAYKLAINYIVYGLTR